MALYNFALITTHNRPELLKQCVAAIYPQVHHVLVIDNASDPPAPESLDYHLMCDDTQPVNMSLLWNRGLNYIEGWTDTSEWNVAILCDDVAPEEGWFQAVSSCMRAHGAVAGSTHQYNPVSAPILKTAPDTDLYNRMCGWAFMVAGEKGLRADEDLLWWWADTHMDFQARKGGGMVIAPGPVAKNIHPNDFTYSVPGLAEQAGRDGETFARIWGGRPW